MDTNGTTLWAKPDATTGAMPRIMLCNLAINPGESERLAKTSKKLENKNFGDQPSKRFSHQDWTVQGELSPDFTTPANDPYAVWCDLFLNGRTLDVGHGLTFEQQLQVPIVIAACEKWAIGILAWVRKIALDSIGPDDEYKFTITLAVKDNWCNSTFDWDQSAGVPAGLEDFQTEIKAYYDGLASSPFAGFEAQTSAQIMETIQKSKASKKKKN